MVMEESDNYSKEELADIFEIVNSQHLHLKGKKKSVSKRQFTIVWKKDNKNLSAYELMIALYKSEDIYDNNNEFMKQFMDNNMMGVDEVKSKRPVSYAKHIKRTRYKDERIEELEEELENVLEDNNLMSKEEHYEVLKEMKKDNKQYVEVLEDKIIKLETQLKFAKGDAEAKVNIANEKCKYLEEQINLISS
jgi:hypothetical protein